MLRSEANIASSIGASLPKKAAWGGRHSVAKSIFDYAFALFLLVALLPALVLIAILIVVDDPGPLFFRQERHGLDRRLFRIYKFRTMRARDSVGAFVQAKSNDPRTTRVGRILRRASLDELPQLLNVLRGEMSLIGPRPHVAAMDHALAPSIHGYWERYLVKPGLSGLAQVRGCRGPTDSLAKARRRIALDRFYVRRWSFWLDIKLLVITPFRIFGPNAV